VDAARSHDVEGKRFEHDQILWLQARHFKGHRDIPGQKDAMAAKRAPRALSELSPKPGLLERKISPY